MMPSSSRVFLERAGRVRKMVRSRSVVGSSWTWGIAGGFYPFARASAALMTSCGMPAFFHLTRSSAERALVSDFPLT